MKPQGRVGDQAFCPSDAHGCPACAHPVTGPAISGSPNVLVNGLAALRDGDPGIHAACCGPNQWKASGGAAHVFINRKQAYRQGDASDHCGGDGHLIQGSNNVFVGDKGGGSAPEKTWIRVQVLDEDGNELPGFDFKFSAPGHQDSGTMTDTTWLHAHDIDPGMATLELKIPEESE